MAEADDEELHWVRSQIEALEQDRVGGRFTAIDGRRLNDLHQREAELLAARRRSPKT